jgi:VIT1/CCC1 family predicted Fe2+/Mn2+ transporter
VFGVSDGLVSNTALVMGFAGSGASRSAILLAGIAGLLAGAFSMAAGEFVSMASQRDMYSREISLEEEELREHPEEERDELVLIYRAKGLTRQQAREVADRVMSNRAIALETLAREELGLDPGELGSPWKAAISSLFAFSAGAFVVVLPYLFLSGRPALISTIILAVLALTAVGAGTGILNGRSPFKGAARQLVAGVLAAGITYGAGALLGTAVG